MASAERTLVDTCVLLESVDVARRHHDATVAFLEQSNDLCLSAQIVREFLVVSTRPPSANGLGMPMPDALHNVGVLRKRLRLLPEERPILPRLLELLAQIDCEGKRIHDASIVASALVHGVARIVTFNVKDFAPFSELVAVERPSTVSAVG